MPIGRIISRATRRMATAAGLSVSALLLMGAGWYGNDYARCRDGTTVAIVHCLDSQTARWQARLDDAHDKLKAAQDTPERKAALAEAQRRWEAYRQANCFFFRHGPGSIAAIDAAECMRVLTIRRARDLAQATRP